MTLKAKIANLQATVYIKKVKKKRSKAFIVRFYKKSKIKVIFYSPRKIQLARQRLKKKQQKKNAAKA